MGYLSSVSEVDHGPDSNFMACDQPRRDWPARYTESAGGIINSHESRGEERKKEKKIGIGQHGVTAKRNFRTVLYPCSLVYDLVLVNIDQTQTKNCTILFNRACGTFIPDLSRSNI